MSFAFLPLYTGDYIRDTRHLTPLRHGVYLLALMHCWDSKGPMPLDEQECAGICNCRSADEIEAMRYVLGRFFVRMDDGHYNERMQKEVERSENISSARADAGRKGYEARAKQLLSKSKASASTPTPTPILSPASHLPSTPPSPKDPSPRARVRSPKASAAVWSAYSQAYETKYGVQPVRNAKVNGQIAQLVGRLGEDEAAGVASFYLGNRNSLYVAAKHCTDLLLRDAEKLRTEWVTGNVTHRRDATEEDRLSSTGEMWKRVGAKLKERGIE